jgi:hypothetical protein
LLIWRNQNSDQSRARLRCKGSALVLRSCHFLRGKLAEIPLRNPHYKLYNFQFVQNVTKFVYKIFNLFTNCIIYKFVYKNGSW